MRKCQKRPIYMAKETYLYGKRDLLRLAYLTGGERFRGGCALHLRFGQCQKRPIHMAKETYLLGKRDLFTWQKRPIYMAKEAYLYGKRGLFIWQTRTVEISIPALRTGAWHTLSPAPPVRGAVCV